MDLIDRSKAVRELHEVYDDMQYERVYEDGETLANEVENILASLPQENQWIPCSERLPKENKDDLHNFLFSDVVMVTVYDIERDKVMGVNCDMTIDGKWQGYQSCDGTEVIAWQPLPEPYKESEKE